MGFDGMPRAGRMENFSKLRVGRNIRAVCHDLCMSRPRGQDIRRSGHTGRMS